MRSEAGRMLVTTLAAGAERDVQRTAALYEEACALGYPTGCRDAAQMCESGRKARLQTLQRAPLPALPKPDRACALGEAAACGGAGG